MSVPKYGHVNFTWDKTCRKTIEPYGNKDHRDHARNKKKRAETKTQDSWNPGIYWLIKRDNWHRNNLFCSELMHYMNRLFNEALILVKIIIYCSKAKKTYQFSLVRFFNLENSKD